MSQRQLSFRRGQFWYGDFLIAVIARDSTVEVVKQHKTLFNEVQRLSAVKSAKNIDLAVLGSVGDKYAVIEEHRPDVICLGYDQRVSKEELERELNLIGINAEIFRLPAHKPHIYKSSKMKK